MLQLCRALTLQEQVDAKQAKCDDLRRQLLEAENDRLEAEASAKPMEIHNHFEPGSSSQVFNDKVNGKFETAEKSAKKNKKEKKEKRRWKKMGYADNMSQFERDFHCREGLLSSAFRNNPYMRLNVGKWEHNGAKTRVLRLVEAYQEAVRKQGGDVITTG